MNPETIAYFLLALGVLCLVAEMFFFTGGILAGLGAFIALSGVAVLFVHGSTQSAMLALFTLCLGVPILGGVFLYLWPYSPLTKKLLRVAEEDATVAAMPANLEREALLGRVGKTISPLRPSGTAEFDGRRVDVLSEGLMIDAGQWVKCVAVQSHKVLVRPADPPSVTKLEEADFS